DDRHLELLAEGLRKRSVWRRNVLPANPERRACEPVGKKIQDFRAASGLEAKVPHRVGEPPQALDRVLARAALRVEEHEAAVDMQIVNAKLFQPRPILQVDPQRIAHEIVAQGPYRRPAKLEHR